MPRWTPEARAAQADIQKTRQSWKSSTGPRTDEGKKIVALNAFKHGKDSELIRELRSLLRQHRALLKDSQ